MTVLDLFLLFVAGAIVGSFLNVLIYRLPRGLSLLRPGSFCPICRESIAPLDNVPLFGFAVRRGVCRSCGGRISWRYPLVEAMAGVLAVASGLRGHDLVDGIALFLFGSTLLTAAATDLEEGVIPDALPVFLVALGLARGATIKELDAAIVGLLVGGGGLWAIASLYRIARKREGLGGGDVKLMAGVGAFLGWQGALLTLFVGSVLATAFVFAIVLRRREVNATTAIPFGPFLAAGAVVVLLA